MGETITLDENFLTTCVNCGGKMPDGCGVYDFYCCVECEQEDTMRIDKMINEGEHPTKIMSDALKKISK